MSSSSKARKRFTEIQCCQGSTTKKIAVLVHTNIESKTDCHDSDIRGSGASIQLALGNSSGASSSVEGLAVKVENEKHVAVKATLVVLKSAKSTLEKRMSEGNDIAAQMSLKSDADAAYKPKTEEILKAMEQMASHLVRLRQTIAKCEACTVSQDCTALAREAESFVAVSEAHCEGAKAMAKRFR